MNFRNLRGSRERLVNFVLNAPMPRRLCRPAKQMNEWTLRTPTNSGWLGKTGNAIENEMAIQLTVTFL